MARIPFILFFSLLFACFNFPLADVRKKEQSPEEFLQYFITGFNAEDAKILDSVFTKPLIRISDGKISSYSSWDKYIDYEKIKATGWAKSVINGSSVPYVDKNSAILKMDFSRLNAAGDIVIRSDVTYMLIKEENLTSTKIF